MLNDSVTTEGKVNTMTTENNTSSININQSVDLKASHLLSGTKKSDEMGDFAPKKNGEKFNTGNDGYHALKKETTSSKSDNVSIRNGLPSASSTNTPGLKIITSIPSTTFKSQQVPICKNCLTSTTPLWRRDESGAMLCNACGLFLKLHGRNRPISLKTDVIKSRNRKCTGSNHDNHEDQETKCGSQIKKYCFAEKKRKSSSASPNINDTIKKNKPNHNDNIDVIPSIDSELAATSKTSYKRGMPLCWRDSNNRCVVNPSFYNNSELTSRQNMHHPPSKKLPGLSSILCNTDRTASNLSCDSERLSNASGSIVSPPNILNHSSPRPSLPQLPVTSIKETLKCDASFPTQNTSVITSPSLPMKDVDCTKVKQQSPDSYHLDKNLPLSITLQNEEEMIKLKARITELELVTDLYRRHIFDLDEKCRTLEAKLQMKNNEKQ
ncbi:Gzf3p NDAI_0G05350 [Naumovozyma dairenensis CBS 421]|uniref:GATA-type domain-containing protein n=1 Tax=Naumovozyma dairenensis (strain ATCC 10597 / BCRC 20456 / CBS 421 / NBRC 0211 / NRRL Y-12639) TaxID=1071378 RepID=J7SB36_NAUDC|nr:hypothetical protein NDAI_0G05350 [Naumovozyma dairenensis CBS 421]CCK73518.1 hypothetical protein NDAI_0G05350 [Naumovozyma dairenensis CBS 421]